MFDQINLAEKATMRQCKSTARGSVNGNGVLSTMQFLADTLNQLDLALDQLALRDSNFDRFSLMLIDNAVELTLHRFAIEKQREFKSWFPQPETKDNEKAIKKALGKNFEDKVTLAKTLVLLSPPIADSIQYLHKFRNTAYHQGVKHEGILHSITKFYLRNACDLLSAYEPRDGYDINNREPLPHRALKYLGWEPPGDPLDIFGGSQARDGEDAFKTAWIRIRQVTDSLGNSLISDLSDDMNDVINSTDENLSFLSKDSPYPTSRDEIVIRFQAWDMISTNEGKQFLSENGCDLSEDSFTKVKLVTEKYHWAFRNDPIPSWRDRLESLRTERDEHTALKKYCDFMHQTEKLRLILEENSYQLDDAIELRIQSDRGN